MLLLMRQLPALLAHPACLSLSPKCKRAMKMLPCIFHCPVKSDSILQKGGKNGLVMGERNREQKARKTSPVSHNSTMINGKGGFSEQFFIR